MGAFGRVVVEGLPWRAGSFWGLKQSMFAQNILKSKRGEL